MSSILNRIKLTSILHKQLPIKSINQSRILDLKQNAKQLNEYTTQDTNQPDNYEEVNQQDREASQQSEQDKQNVNSNLIDQNDKFNILNENSLSSQILNRSKFKSNAQILIKQQADLNIQLIKFNFRNFLIYDENDKFVQTTINCIATQLDLDPNEAKKYFFKLKIPSDSKWNDLFGRSNSLEKCFKDLKYNLSKEQIIAEFDLIINYNKSTSTKLNILKLIGLKSNLNTSSNFQMLINQNEATLKELNILQKDSNLLDTSLNQLNLTEKSKRIIKSRIGQTHNLTIKQVLDRLSRQYFKFTLNIDNFKNLKRSFFSIAYLDLLNIDNILSFFNHLKFDRHLSEWEHYEPTQVKQNEIEKILRLIKYPQLIEIDEYLKLNELQFIWNHLLAHPSVFQQADQLVNKLNYLIKLNVPKKMINDQFVLFVSEQVKLEFFVTKFGRSFFEYSGISTAFKKYNQIIQKLNELSDEEIKNHTFTEFMHKHYGQ